MTARALALAGLGERAFSATASAAFTVRASGAPELLTVPAGTTVPALTGSVIGESCTLSDTLKAPAVLSVVAPELNAQAVPVGAGVKLKPGLLAATVKVHVVSGALPTVALTPVFTGWGVFRSGAPGLP